MSAHDRQQRRKECLRRQELCRKYPQIHPSAFNRGDGVSHASTSIRAIVAYLGSFLDIHKTLW